MENTGLEFIYSQKRKSEQGHDQSSCIFYKFEYPKIQALVRYHGQLSTEGAKEREEELKRTYHPGCFRRLGRKCQNVFKTIRDSVAEVVNILISHAKKATPAGGVLTSQDKYVSQMKQELMSSEGASFEPLLEKYIGHKVALELIRGDKVFEYCGVLKDYTAVFVEIMDVDYKPGEDAPVERADLIVPRKYGIVRHLAE